SLIRRRSGHTRVRPPTSKSGRERGLGRIARLRACLLARQNCRRNRQNRQTWLVRPGIRATIATDCLAWSLQATACGKQGRIAMKRRDVLKSGLAVVGTASLAAPAIAQSAPAIRWRLTSSFPKSLDTIYGGGEFFADRVSKLTDGKFNIRVFAAGD